MALILCVETSSTNCSVALATDNEVSFVQKFGVKSCWDLLEDNSDNYSHGERLHLYIEEILTRNNVKPQDLDAIAVSAGPGSYTGLRIGVATVKGLCYSLDIPMIAISTLASLKVQASGFESDYIIPMLDARRMEVYAAIYKNDELLETARPIVLDEISFLRFRESSITTFIGTGVDKFKDLIKEESHHYITANPTAITLCDIAMDKYKISDTVDVAYFEPFYLKEFKAG